jgi:mannitol-1-phosphate/altronate dehydrogenase
MQSKDKISDIEKINHRLELLRMAKEIANEEYLNKRAEDHNKWIALNDLAKLQNKMRVPYPPFVAFPTEEYILEKARALCAFVYGEENTEVIEPFTDIVLEEVVKEVVKEVAEKNIEEIVKNNVEEMPPLMSDDSKHESHGFLPGWIRRPR